MINIQLVGNITKSKTKKIDKNQKEYLLFEIETDQEDIAKNLCKIKFSCFVFNSDKVNCKKFNRGLFIKNRIFINGSLFIDGRNSSINVHEVEFLEAAAQKEDKSAENDLSKIDDFLEI